MPMPLTNRPTRLEHFEEDKGLKPHTMHDWQLAREKAAAEPASLTERDFLIIEHFDGVKAADAARHAATPAPPVVPATKASPVAEAPVSLAVSTAIILKATKRDPDPAFDRVKFAAAARADRAEWAPIVPGAYDPIAFTVAHAQFKNHPAGLTDSDIAQLKLVDDDLGNEAMAARVGYVEAKSDEEHDSGLSHMPVSARGLIAFVGLVKDGFSVWISTLQRLARETRVRVDQLEQRLVDPKDASTALSQAQIQIKALTDRINHLEVRPTLEYQGVFESGKTYKRGDAVTWKGSVWIAHFETNAAPTFGVTVGPRPWQLAVRAGRDGRDVPERR